MVTLSTTPVRDYWQPTIPYWSEPVGIPAPVSYPVYVQPFSPNGQRVYDLEQEVKRLRKELDELKALLAR